MKYKDFIQQAADDYDISFEDVQRIFDRADSLAVFYELLEEFIYERSHTNTGE